MLSWHLKNTTGRNISILANLQTLTSYVILRITNRAPLRPQHNVRDYGVAIL